MLGTFLCYKFRYSPLYATYSLLCSSLAPRTVLKHINPKIIHFKQKRMKKGQAEAMVEAVKEKVVAQVDKSKVLAEKELAKVKKHLESTYATVEKYAKKNPEKAALVAAGIGAALGAAIALLVSGGKKGKK